MPLLLALHVVVVGGDQTGVALGVLLSDRATDEHQEATLTVSPMAVDAALHLDTTARAPHLALLVVTRVARALLR